MLRHVQGDCDHNHDHDHQYDHHDHDDDGHDDDASPPHVGPRLMLQHVLGAHDDDGHNHGHADDHDDNNDHNDKGNDADDHNGKTHHNHDDHIRDWAYLSSLLAPSRLPLPYSTFHFILLAGIINLSSSSSS